MLRPTNRSREPRAAIVLAAATVALLASAEHSTAQAQIACGDRQAIANLLKTHYAEVPTGIGLGQDGRVFELFSAPEGASWSVVATSPQGRSCILAAGRSWSEQSAPTPGLESSWRSDDRQRGDLP